MYRGADGQFFLYEDDGISQAYLRGGGALTRLTWQDATRRLMIAPAAARGATRSAASRTFEIVMLPEGTKRTVTYSGVAVAVTMR